MFLIGMAVSAQHTIVQMTCTTFSTFGLDTFLLTRTHSVGQAASNVAIQVAGGLAAVWIGYQVGKA